MDISLGVSRIDSLFFGKMMADMWWVDCHI
jgi:hypothetical protein